MGIEARPGPSATSTDHLAVTLDKRALKTPSGNPLVLPRRKTLAATLIAAEWDNQETLLKQHSLPMVRLPSTHVVEHSHDEHVRQA